MTIRASHVSIGLHQEGSENSNASAWKGVCSFRCYVAKTDKKSANASAMEFTTAKVELTQTRSMVFWTRRIKQPLIVEGGEWLDLHYLKAAYLATKPVLKTVSRDLQTVPLAPAPYAHAATQTRSGVTAHENHSTETKFNVGPAATVTIVSQTQKTSRKHKPLLKQLKPKLQKPHLT